MQNISKAVGTNASSIQNHLIFILSSALFIILICIFSSISYADTIVPGGTIDQNTTWNLAGSPYIVQGNVTVASGVTLTIEAGVSVKFDGYYQLRIDGSLIADGTSSNRISFMSNRSQPGRNDWHSLYLNGPNSISQISYWTLQHATFGIYFNNASPQVSDSIFSYDGNGMWITNNSSPVITRSQFTYNDQGLTIQHLTSDPHPTINRSSFHDNNFVNVDHSNGFSDPSQHYDFTDNWWGTTNQDTIARRITDHQEQYYFPTIDFIPFLDSENGNPYLGIYNVSHSPLAIDNKIGETVTIHYSLTADAFVTLTIELASGFYPRVRTLLYESNQAAGDHSVDWDGRNDSGELLAYDFYRVTIQAHVGDQSQSYHDEFSGNNFCIAGAYTEHADFDPFKNERMLLHIYVANPGIQGIFIAGNGERVRELSRDMKFVPGNWTLDWDGRTDSGQIFSGAYSDITFTIPGLFSPQAIVLKNSTEPPTNFSSEAYLILPPQGEVSTLKYTLSAESVMTVTVKDPNGNYFRTLLNQTDQSPGTHTLLWDGRNDLGETASTEGSYQVQVRAVNPVSGEYAQNVGSVMVFQ